MGMIVPDQVPCSGSSMVTQGTDVSDYDDVQISYVSPGQGVEWIHSFPDSTFGPCVQGTLAGRPVHTSTIKFF